MSSEVAARADFSRIRYAQCWEDADVLLEALDIEPGDVCVAIASAGDNAIAMLARDPGRVVALDLSPAQIACLEIRVAAYRVLEHGELLELIGSRPSARRAVLYRRCRGELSPDARRFWDERPRDITNGIGGVGKFERYLALGRRWVLPLVHSSRRIRRLFEPAGASRRRAFYDGEWDILRWRFLIRLFFSRFVLGHGGRDPSFFRYAENDVASQLLERARHAAVGLDPADNPYLRWALTGSHGDALPFALRPENFAAIRANLDQLEWRTQSLEDFLEETGDRSIDRFNLSNIFEYMSRPQYHRMLDRLARAGRTGARLAYWNFLVPRHRPASMARRLDSLDVLARDLHARDKTFFYSDFVVEEVR